MTSKGNFALHVRLDPLLSNGLRARALAGNVTVNELAKFVLGEYVKQAAEDVGGIPVLLRHLDVLVRTLELQANQLTLRRVAGSEAVKEPMKAEKDTQTDRLGLHETVDDILKAVIKLCENEDAAKNAKARMEAMRLANITVRTDLALLQGFDRRDIQVLIDEVKKTNESLKEQLRASAKGPKRN